MRDNGIHRRADGTFVVTTRKGGAWSIKVKGGVKLVDALRTLGVIVKPQS